MPDQIIETSIAEAQADAQRAMDELGRRITDTDGLRHDYAIRIADRARRNAAGRPTPQAALAAAGIRVKRGSVLGFPSTRVLSAHGAVKLGAIGYGSEFGSDQYRQFGPRRESGYWLNPAAEQVDDAAGVRWLEGAMDAAIRKAKQ